MIIFCVTCHDFNNVLLQKEYFGTVKIVTTTQYYVTCHD
jgi:nitrate/TMAO reductase-like tetraheme cytochrome c subunit